MNWAKASPSWSTPKNAFSLGDAREAGARHVDEDQIGGVEQAGVVVDELVGRGRVVAVVGGDDAPGAEGAHVQPHGGGAGAAVEEEGDGALLGRGAALEIGGVEHGGFGAVLAGVLLIFRRVGLHVVPVLLVNDERAGDGVVGDGGAAGGHRAAGALLLRLEIAAVDIRGLVLRRRRVVGEGARRGEGDGNDRQQGGEADADALRHGAAHCVPLVVCPARRDAKALAAFRAVPPADAIHSMAPRGWQRAAGPDGQMLRWLRGEPQML